MVRSAYDVRYTLVSVVHHDCKMEHGLDKAFCNNKILELRCVECYLAVYGVGKSYFFVWIFESYHFDSPIPVFFFGYVGFSFRDKFTQQLLVSPGIVAFAVEIVVLSPAPLYRIDNI